MNEELNNRRKYTKLKDDELVDSSITILIINGRIYADSWNNILLYPNVKTLVLRGAVICSNLVWKDFFQVINSLQKLENLDLAYQDFNEKLLKYLPQTVKYLNITSSSVTNLDSLNSNDITIYVDRHRLKNVKKYRERGISIVYKDK